MRPYLQLLRAPNVFTAAADILLGYFFTHESLDSWPQLALLLAASCSLYLAGMALNDVFDVEQDARERPFRPIPSGRISKTSALRLGFGMLAAGVALCWLTTWLAGDLRPGLVASALACAVLAYDGLFKKTPVGPLVMGLCRTLNVLLGMSASQEEWSPVYWAVALGIGIYITGVTVFARSEARKSGRWQLALGFGLLLAGLGVLDRLTYWVRGDEWPPVFVPPRWSIFWLFITALVAWRCVRAIVSPVPGNVQSAVRYCILSLIVIDAGACLAVHDLAYSLSILALLIPTITLGRWIYST
jgi:4-hydroxybenzoate polyprenyltransferase